MKNMIYRVVICAAAVTAAVLWHSAYAKPKGFYYVVKDGDTLWGLSRLYKVELSELRAANTLLNPQKIQPGQQIFIPGEKSLGSSLKDVFRKSSDYYKMQQICVCPVKLRPWKYIVIHHSATDVGNARMFHRYHKKRGMENGLAYHFVITNGTGGKDGTVEASPRWHKQLQGGHVSEEWMNEVGIGICLVGNFQKNYPTDEQIYSLVNLIKYLQLECGIPSSRVITHKEVKKGHTACPGKFFPMKKIKTLIFS